jgi:hypothetical protein
MFQGELVDTLGLEGPFWGQKCGGIEMKKPAGNSDSLS